MIGTGVEAPPPTSDPSETTTTTEVEETTTTADAAAALPRTGASTGPAIYAGFGFLTVGLAALAVARRRQARSLS